MSHSCFFSPTHCDYLIKMICREVLDGIVSRTGGRDRGGFAAAMHRVFYVQ